MKVYQCDFCKGGINKGSTEKYSLIGPGEIGGTIRDVCSNCVDVLTVATGKTSNPNNTLLMQREAKEADIRYLIRDWSPEEYAILAEILDEHYSK